MSRIEKIVAFLFGALVFAGLFVFIFTSLRTPPAAPPLGDTAVEGLEDDEPFDFNVGADTETVTDVAPEENEAPISAASTPTPVKTEKK